MAHFRIKCRCGNVVSECRCPGQKAETTVDHCDKCNTGSKWYIRHRLLSRKVAVEILNVDAHGFETGSPKPLGYYVDDAEPSVITLHTYGPFDTEEAAKADPRAWVEDVS